MSENKLLKDYLKKKREKNNKKKKNKKKSKLEFKTNDKVKRLAKPLTIEK
jgi:hypothetical protein